MSHDAYEIRRASVEDLEPLSRMLCEAFSADPYYRWMLPTDALWERASPLSFGGLLSRFIPCGTVITTEGLGGVLVWSPPGYRPTLRRRLAHVVRQIRIASAMGAEQARRVRDGLQMLGAAGPKFPHVSVIVLATARDQQGKGVGKSLIEACLREADEAGHPVATVATTDLHVAFYRRYAASLLAEAGVTLPGGPTVYPMLRKLDGARDDAPAVPQL